MSITQLLAGGGTMGSRIRAHDWASSPLGTPETWPPSLQVSLSNLLRSKLPTYLVWGPELITFYNDACLPLRGNRPEALGQPLPQAWAEVWDVVALLVTQAFRGEATYIQDVPVDIVQRGGHPEQTWWNGSFSPVLAESGAVGGVLITLQETTERVLTERRLRFLVDLSTRLRDVAEARDVMATATEMLGRHLRASRVGYAELSESGKSIAVERDWTEAGIPSCAGEYRIGDFGALIENELKAGRTVRIHDILADPLTAEESIIGEFLRTGRRATIITPLMRDGRFVASFYVHQAEQRHWHKDEVTLVQEVAERTWTSVLRARAETTLRESEERYRQLAEAVPQVVWSADATGDVDFFNSRWFAYTGLSDDESYDGRWASTIHPDDRTHILEHWAEAIRTGTAMEFEYRLRRSDGVYRWHLDRAVPMRDDQGRVVRWFGTFTDIDDRKRAEEALRQSEERFRHFAEHSIAVLWMLDVETMQLEFLSPSFQQVWGEAREVAPRDFAHWLGTIHPDDREAAITTLWRIQEGEVVVWEYRIVRPDGSVRWIQNTGFPIQNESDRVVRVAGIAQDITQHDGSMVYVVDGNDPSRHTRAVLLQGAGYQVKVFDSAERFLEVAPVLVPGCVVLDMRAAEAGGLTIPKALEGRRSGLPVIVLGEARGNIAVGVQAMKAGAVDFLEASCQPEQLLEAVASALASIRDIAVRDQTAELARTRIAALPPREREVLDGLLTGGTNKTIARDLGISPRTVEAHRARIMERLGAQSLPELVQTAIAAGLQAKPQGNGSH